MINNSKIEEAATMNSNNSNNTNTNKIEEAAKMNRQQIIDKIIEYFENNEDAFNACIEELDSYNGYLGDDRYYEMYMLSEFYTDTDPIELLNRAYFGRDDDSWYTDQSGNKIHDSFNPNRNYFYYNGYGNLVSSNYKDYSDHLDKYAIEQMSNNRNWIDSIDEDSELSELFDELEEAC